MYYNYLCNGEKVRVFKWNYKFRGVTVDYKGNEYDLPILTDDKDDYIIWKETKIYLDDFVKISIEELNNKKKEDKYWLIDEYLVTAILSEGVKNVGFVLKENNTLYKIDESKYQVKNNYKITLVGPDKLRHDFYIMDFTYMVMDGIFDMVRLCTYKNKV